MGVNAKKGDGLFARIIRTCTSSLNGIDYLNFIADVYGIPAELRRQRIESLCGAFELKGRWAAR